jgi:UrcA family protein
MHSFQTRLIAAFGALVATTASVMASAPAAASTLSTEALQKRIRYEYVDVSTPDGAARLDRRIKAAASQVCPSNLLGVPGAARCYRHALDDARRQASVQLAGTAQGDLR